VDGLTESPTTEDAAVVVEGVSKRFRLYKDKPSSLKQRITSRRGAAYDEFWALRDVSFSVPRGSAFALVGHNGSGKSTLLRLMAGIHRPTTGTIQAKGRVSALLELGAGFHPELSGRENIYLNGSILGLTKREISSKIDEIIDFSGISEFIDSPVKVYSSGMYVRLGFSVAVHVNPDILIIDEVIAVGDEEFQRQCFDHLYKLRGQGVTIIVVSHSLALVQTMCDHAAWFDHGHLLHVGTAGDVVHQYLDKVNVNEAQRIEDEAERLSADIQNDSHEDPNEAPRSAPSLITIEAVDFLGPDGMPTHVAEPKAPLTVRLHFHSHVPIESPLFSFAVENENDVLVANPGIRPTHSAGPTYHGVGYADYQMTHLPLGPGEYTFSVAIHDTNGMTVLDKKMRFARLKVQPGSDLVHGVVDLLGQWMPVVAKREEAS
jgi:lipopolysaccharide transport system ATP-binding protein